MFRKKNDPDLIKRKSYYSFSKDYPGKIGSKGYAIGDSKDVKKRELKRHLLELLILIAIFTAAFLVTSFCFDISEKQPLPEKEKPAVQTEAFSEKAVGDQKENGTEAETGESAESGEAGEDNGVIAE